jgi:hypothetical protein
MYLTGDNKDYLSTTLIIAVKLSEKEEYRKVFRKNFLPSQKNQYISIIL